MEQLERIMLGERPKIKFSEDYWKLGIIGYPKTAVLTQVKEVNLEDLSEEFKEMDTRFFYGRRSETAQGNEPMYGHYQLPKKGKYLALGFGKGSNLADVFGNKTSRSIWADMLSHIFSDKHFHYIPVDFCTLRSRYGKHGDKLRYYSALIGKEFDVVMPK